MHGSGLKNVKVSPNYEPLSLITVEPIAMSAGRPADQQFAQAGVRIGELPGEQQCILAERLQRAGLGYLGGEHLAGIGDEPVDTRRGRERVARQRVVAGDQRAEVAALAAEPGGELAGELAKLLQRQRR